MRYVTNSKGLLFQSLLTLPKDVQEDLKTNLPIILKSLLDLLMRLRLKWKSLANSSMSLKNNFKTSS